MTATTTSPVDSAPTRTAAQRTFQSYIVFTIWACLYILPLIRLYLVGTDEGTLDVGAVRVFHGQVFARDFFEVMGPGTFYWVACFFKIFGVTFLATRICLFPTSLGTALLMYFLSQRICRTHQMLPAIILGGTIFPGLWPAISHHNDSMFFGLLAVVCIVLWQDTRHSILLFAAGALTGLTSTFLQPKGLFLFLAFLAWLSILRWRKLCSLSSLAIVTAGYVAVLGLVIAYFWSKGALGSLIFANFTWPSHHYGTVNAVGYGHGLISNHLKVSIINEPGLRWTIALAAVTFIPFLFIAALPALLPTVAARFRWNLKSPDVLLYWLCGIGIWLSEVHRPDVPRLVYGSPLLIILCVHFVTQYRASIARVSLRILSLSAVTLLVFNLLCVLFAERTITTRVGTVRMLKDAPVLDFINEHVATGEEIFAYPYCPRYYFLSSTINPTPYSILMYNYNTSDEFRTVVRILEQHKVKYVLWDNNFFKNASEAFPGDTTVPPRGSDRRALSRVALQTRASRWWSSHHATKSRCRPQLRGASRYTMSTSLVSPAKQTAGPASSVRGRLVSYFFFAFCTSVYLFPFLRLLMLETDEGLLVTGAVRIAQGQVFARDFVEIVGPGTFYWLALFFKLFGITFQAERICLYITTLGTLSALYFLTRRICERNRLLPCTLVAGTYFGMFWPTISHHVDSNFFALVSVAFMVLWHDNRKTGLLLAAGTLAGVTTCIHQPKGILLFCAFEVWLWLQHRKRSSPLFSLGAVLGGYIAALGLMVVYFWSQDALWDLIYANYIWPSTHYGPLNVVPYAQGIFVQYWQVWASLPGAAHWTVMIAVILILPFLLIAGLPAVLPVLALINIRKSPNAPVQLYWLCGWAIWLAELHRKDIQHLVFGSPLLVLLCIYYLQNIRCRITALALQFITISGGCLACMNFFLALAAHPVATRVGTVAMFKTEPAIAFLNEHVPRGQDIFVYPYCPMYYFITGTTNPTRWSGLGYGYNSPSEFQEVVRVLDQHRVKYVVWDTLLVSRLSRFSPTLYKPRPDELIMEPYLESHYKSVWEQNGIRILERIGDAPTR